MGKGLGSSEVRTKLGEGRKTGLDIGMIRGKKRRGEGVGVITHEGLERGNVRGRVFVIVVGKFHS